MRNSRRKGLDLDGMVESGPESAYEALQLYKSKISRLRSKGAFDEAMEICSNSCVHLLKHGYESAGNELAHLYVDILEETKLDLSPTIRQQISQISTAYNLESTGANAAFLRECVKCSVTSGQRLYGDVILQRQLGQCLWLSGDHCAAVKHLVLGESPESLWSLLSESYITSDSINRRNELFTIAILYFLAYENIRDAFTLMDSLKKDTDPSIASSWKQIEFCDRLLLTSLRDAKPLFKVRNTTLATQVIAIMYSLVKKLVNAYIEYLRFDPVVESLLMGPIAKKLFGIESPPNMMTIIQNMLAGA